jgi:outer membrane lipoprotein-sorting protein
MKKFCLILFTLIICINLVGQEISAKEILQKIDNNILSDNQFAKTKMIVHGRRNSRTLVMKSYSRNNEDSFTEYLAPAREKGTKMLKLKDNLWIYSPKTDRIIRISGHMLRQSVMGSDMSYEDLMSDSELVRDYKAVILGTETINDRRCWKLELTALSPDLAYAKRIIWVDQERFLGLKEELYALSGKLLKKTEIHEVFEQDGRWFPRHLTYRDMLKSGKGTEIIFEEIDFNTKIPSSKFSKASLKK